MKKITIFILLIMSINMSAQFEDIFASNSDADKFVSNYTQPIFKGLMYATNAGWISSAKPIKTFHVELHIFGAGAFVPTSDESFKFNQADYKYLEIESGPNSIPTAMGDQSQTTMKIVIPFNNTKIKLLEFNAPDGIKGELPINAVPAPMAQLSVGLPLGSEINIRYTPKFSNDGGFFQSIGFGIKHSISQYLPLSKNNNKSVFNLAGHISYQNISAGFDSQTNNKAVHFNISTIGIQGIASMDYKLISLYSSIGYTKGYTSLNVLGTYKYTYEIRDNNDNHLGYQSVSINDPLKLSSSMSGMKALLGFKLKLAFFQIYADYTLQEYPVARAGIGFKI